MSYKSSISDLDVQIEKLRERKKLLIVKSAERFARAAMKSGLAEMEIADDELDRIFEEIAARFRDEAAKQTASEVAKTHRSADSGVGAQAQISHGG